MTYRIAFYLDCDFLSGAERQAVNNANFLHSSGWQVTIFHRGIPELVAMRKDGRLKVPKIQQVHSLEDKVSLRKVPGMLRPLLELMVCFQAYSSVRKSLGGTRCDILHVNNGGFPGSPGSLGAAIAGGKLGIKTFMTVNNLAIRRPPIFLLARWMPKSLKQSVSRWVTGSTAAAEQLAASLSLAPELISVIPNGAVAPACICDDNSYDIHLRGMLDSRDLILSVGHLEPRKGHLGLLEIAQNLMKIPQTSADSWVIGIEGQGPLESDLKKEIVARGLQDKVLLLGRTECLGHLYASARLLCHLSLDLEDLPNVISEAMSFNLPVVAFDVGGISDQVRHGKTGFLYKRGDYSNASLGVAKILSDERVHRTMSTNAALRYQTIFSPSNALRHYASLYGLTEA